MRLGFDRDWTRWSRGERATAVAGLAAAMAATLGLAALLVP